MISVENDYEIHLKRNPVSCFVNSYNLVLLEALLVNLDFQPVHNLAPLYMAAFCSKSESDVSEALKQVVWKIRTQNSNVCEIMKKIAGSFISSR